MTKVTVKATTLLIVNMGCKPSWQRFKQSSSWGVDDLWLHEIHDILIVLGFKAKSDCDDVRIYVPKTILVPNQSACKIIILVIFYSLMGVSYKEYFINWILDLEVYFDPAKVLEYFKV